METTTTASYWEQLNEMIGEDRRREKRLSLAVPIEVHGFDSNGRFFVTRTVTHNISEGGCCLLLEGEPEPGGVLAIRVIQNDGQLHPQKPLLFQVAWIEAEEGHWLIGARKLQPDNIWHVAFPKKEKDSVTN